MGRGGKVVNLVVGKGGLVSPAGINQWIALPMLANEQEINAPYRVE